VLAGFCRLESLLFRTQRYCRKAGPWLGSVTDRSEEASFRLPHAEASVTRGPRPPTRGFTLLCGMPRRGRRSEHRVRGRPLPTPAWLTTSANVQDDCQPLAVLSDFWTHPRHGLGLPFARLDTAGLDAVAAILRSEGVGISGVILNASRFTSLVAQLLDHFDGYLTVNAAGQIGVGLVRGPPEPNRPSTPPTCCKIRTSASPPGPRRSTRPR